MPDTFKRKRTTAQNSVGKRRAADNIAKNNIPRVDRKQTTKRRAWEPTGDLQTDLRLMRGEEVQATQPKMWEPTGDLRKDLAAAQQYDKDNAIYNNLHINERRQTAARNQRLANQGALAQYSDFIAKYNAAEEQKLQDQLKMDKRLAMQDKKAGGPAWETMRTNAETKQADYYHAQYYRTGSDEDYQRYLQHMNTARDYYGQDRRAYEDSMSRLRTAIENGDMQTAAREQDRAAQWAPLSQRYGDPMEDLSLYTTAGNAGEIRKLHDESPAQYYASVMNADEIQAEIGNIEARMKDIEIPMKESIAEDNQEHIVTSENMEGSARSQALDAEYEAANRDLITMQNALRVRQAWDEKDFYEEQNELSKTEGFDRLAAEGERIFWAPWSDYISYQNENNGTNMVMGDRDYRPALRDIFDDIKDKEVNPGRTRNPVKGFSDEERKVFYALVAMDPSGEKAKRYIEYKQKEIESKKYQELINFGENGGFGNRALAFIGGTGLRTLSGIVGIGENIVNDPLVGLIPGYGAAKHLFGGGGEWAESLSRTSSALMEGGSRGATKEGLLGTGLMKDTKWPGFIYSTASSMAESGAAAAAAKALAASGHPGLAAVVQTASTAIMGSSASTADYIEMKDAGWGEAEARAHATCAGLWEFGFEYVSLDHLVDQDEIAGLLKNMFQQGGIEASEELCTSIAGSISDAAIAEMSGRSNKIERTRDAYMQDGYSFESATQKAKNDFFTDILFDALGGLASGGVMSFIGSNGISRTAGKVADAGRYVGGKISDTVSNVKGLYTQDFGDWLTDTPELHQNAMESTVNRAVNDQSGGIRNAMQAYAEKNGITLKEMKGEIATPSARNDSTESEASAEAAGKGLPALQNAETRKDSQKVSRRTTKAFRANVEAVTNSIADKMYSKSETVDGRMEGAVAVYEQTVSEYGEGIKPVAQAALRNTVNKIVSEAGNKGNVSATTAFQEQVGKIENPEARDVAQEALDYAVYRKTTNAMQNSEIEEGLRHLDESSAVAEMRAQRTQSRGELTMKATVTDENGQSKAVDIVGITEGGKAVELSDGVKIDVKDLQTDADTKDAIQMIASMELGSNANKVLQAYRDSGLSGTEGYRFIADYTQAIEQGRTNRVSLERATKASSLDAKTVMEAYTIGQQIAHAETQKAMDRLKNAPKKKGATGRTARIDTSAIEGITMSQSEREQFELANRIFTALGVDLRWVASSEKNGKFVGANGSYLNGAVTLDIHAGRNFLNDIRSGILATTGHELTHFLEQYAPEQYKALKEFVFQQIVQNGKYGEETLERLIQEKKKRARNKISQREAENEVVADACQNMLLDSKAVSRFAQEHEDAAKGIVRWLDKWFGKLKSAFTGSRLSEEARMMNNLEKDVKQAFGDLWDKALEEAVRMHDEVGDMESEREGQNSDRDTEYLERDSDGNVLSDGQKEYFKDSKIRDKYGNLLTLYHGTAADFTVFDLSRAGKNYDGWSEYGAGIYLTPDKKFATYFSESASQRGGTPNLMELYANIKNPFNVNDPVTVDVSEYAKKHKLTEDDVRFLKKNGDRWLAFMREHNEDIYDFLTSHGYDGLWDAYGTHAPTQIVAFTENQVKNSDNKNPTENLDIRYSERDYDNTVSDVDLLLQQKVEDAANLEQGRLLKEFQAKAKQVQELEAKLKKAKADLKRTDRSYNTRGIQKLVGGIMKTFGMGDAKNLGIQKTAAETLQKAYDKAIAAIDRGESPMEIVYQGALDLADYLLENGTYREKQGFKWDRAKWAQVYANTEEARQHAVDDVVSAVYQDFGMNRYREAVQATAVDRIVDRVENRYNQKLDAVKAENKALQQANDKLQAEQKILKEIEDQQRTVVNNLNEMLQDTRAELKQARKDNSKDVKRLEQKVSRLASDLRTAKERVQSWEEKAKHLGNYSQALIDSKNRDIRDLRQKLNSAHAELQAAASQIEEMKGWEEKAKHAGVYSQQLIDSKNRDIAKLGKEIQKHRDILAGKLRNPQLTAMLKAAKEAQYKKDQEAKEAQFAGYKDRKNRTAIRNRIKNLHAEMNRDLLRPREGHFVPEKLIRPVVDLLDLVNTETNRAKSESAQARIAAINAAYDAIKKDERYSQYYDETVKDMLVELSGTLAGRSIYDLTTAELEDVYTVMKAMRTTIRNAIKADLIEKGKEIWEIGNEMRQELRAGRGAHALQLLEKYHMTMLSAKRAFNRFGGYQQSSAWNKVYRMLDDAQLKMLTLEMQGTRIFDRVLEGKENLEKAEKLTSYREDDLVDVGLKDETGKAVPIPRGMMLSLYMHLQNEENMRHLMYGGITLPDFKRYYKGRSEAWGQGTVSIPALGARVAALDELFSKGELSDAEYEEAYKEHKAEIDEIFDSIRTAIEEQLTDYDRQWIAASREFFDGFSRRELNRVTNEMYGFSKARVDNYFPIVTDSDFLKSEFESISKNISLENAGFMKERVRASNPIHLEDITKAVNRQISNVSRYAGLTQALKTFGNVYNVQDRGFTDSVKKAMAKTYGKNGQQYVENLITDMVGGRNTPGTIFDRVKGNYAQAVLAANLSVTIKQAASFPTAAATVGWGPLMKALARGGKSNLPISRADSNLISIYSPLLWYRSKGAIDVEIGDIANGRDWTQKAKWLMGWIEKTDRATVGRLWYAAEYYVKDNYNLEKGTEEQIKNGESPFYRKVAEVFADIVEDTQPNYTILQRPDILRNPNKLVRAMVMFSTQRFQNGNILIDAIGEYRAMVRADKQNGTPKTKAARKAARQKLTRAISSQTVSAMVLSAMTLLAGAVMHRMNPWRDDDDELTFESIAEEYLNGFLSSLTGSFLAGSEIYEGLQAMLTGSKYYGNDVGGISTINELATAVIQFEQQAVRLIGDEDSTAKDWQNLAEKQLWKVGEYLSQMTGIPTANIKKIIEGGRNHIADIMNEEFFSFEAGVERTNKVNAHRFYEAWKDNDRQKMNRILDEVKASGNSAQSIENAFGKQAKEAYESGEIDIDQYEKFLYRTGLWDDEKIEKKVIDIIRDEYKTGIRSDEETEQLLIKYNSKVENKDDAWKVMQRWGATAEHAGEEDYNYSEYETFYNSLDEGKSFDEAATEYLDHGYKEENLRSNAVKHVKALYQAGELTEDKAIEKYMDVSGKDENDAWKAVKKWGAEAEHADEEDYSYSQYDAIDAAIDKNDDINALVKDLTDHGFKQDSITDHVKGYLKQRYIDGYTTEKAYKNQLSRYCGIVGETADKEVKNANFKKFTGYTYDDLDNAYKDGNVDATTAKQALTKYGGMTTTEASAKVRYWDFQKAYPDANMKQETVDKYYDNVIAGTGRTLKASGLSLDNFVKYYTQASRATGTDKDGDGKTDSGSKKAAIMQIIDKLNLTTAQKDALYYFNGWAAKTIKEAPWH